MDIENTWKNQSNLSYEATANELQASKSKDLVSKIISRLKLEQRVTYLASPIILYCTIANGGYLLSAIGIAYLILLIFYYRHILRKIEAVAYKDSVLKFLNSSVNAMRWFKVHYIGLSMISFAVGVLITTGTVISNPDPFFTPIAVLIMLAGGISISYLGYYIHYQPYFANIKKIITELKME